MKLKGVVKNSLIFVAFIAIIVIVAIFLMGLNKPEEIIYSDFETKLQAGEIKAVFIEDQVNMKIIYKNSKFTVKDLPKNADAVTIISDRRSNATLLSEYNKNVENKVDGYKDFSAVNVKYDDPYKGNIWSTLLPILASLGLLVLLIFMYKQTTSGNNKAMNFGKNRAKQNVNVKVRFSDVAGAVEEKEELREIVDFLKNPKKFTEVGARIPRGVLLVGRPGTGKTLFAKAVAGEANVPFFTISGSDFVEMFVGVGASRVRDLFDQAKRNMPCIIFIDEIDAVGRQRGAGLGGGHDEREQTLNQLLVQMDGFESNEGIIIMAATNRVDILDPALLRPGRFDRQIYVNAPDVKGREQILKVHSRNKPISSNIDFKILARMTSGFTGADIENLLNEAAILAARDSRKVIIMEDILEGINKVAIGPQKKSRLVTESDKRITAYHECGHAIIGKILPGCEEVQEVSIIPRGQAAGYTLTRPDRDDMHVSKNKLLDMIVMLLGGRAAEDIVIHDITTGASSDIQRASGVARSMVTEWGMSPLGNLFLGGESEVFLGRDYQKHSNISEKLSGLVDDEVRKIIDESYKKAIDILTEYRNVMENMVKLLFEKETIYAEEVQMLFDGKSIDEIIKVIDEKMKIKEEKVNNFDDIVVKEKDIVDAIIDNTKIKQNEGDIKEEENSEDNKE